METIFLINFFLSLFISVFLALSIFKRYREKKINEIIGYISFLGLFYFVLAIYSLVWFLNLINYSSDDFFLVYSLVVFVLMIFSLRIYYLLSNNKKIFFSILVYLFLILKLVIPILNPLNVFIVLSFVILLSLFVVSHIVSNGYRSICKYGIIYSSLSLFFYFILMYQIGDLFFYSVISNIFFFVFIYDFEKNINKYSLKNKKNKKSKSRYLIYFRYLVFLILLTSFVFISTIAIHEFGHYFLSKLYGCESRTIIYESSYPHTESLCEFTNIKNLLLISGFLFPFFLSIFLFIIGGNFIREISILILGFNFIVSYKDFFDLGVSENISFLFIFLGFFLIILGIFILAKSITEDYIHLLVET